MSFVNSIFLFATAAAAIPVILHLVRRIKAKPVPFGSLMFLSETPKELVRRRRLKDRLLMAARALILLVLAFVFARPYFPEAPIALIPGREASSVVYLVDTSFSMRRGDAMERAKSAIREQLRSDTVHEAALVRFDAGAELAASLSPDLAPLRAALDATEAGYSASDMLPALQRAADVLADARNARRRIVLVSDLQESAWERVPPDWKLPASIEFETIFVGDPELENAFFEAVLPSQRRVDGRSAIRADARVVRSESAATRIGDVRLILDDAERTRSSLPDRPQATVTLEDYAPRTGFVRGELVLSGDAFPDDDQYFFTARVAPSPTLLVADAPSAGGRRDAFYLRTAFDLGDEARFRFVSASRPSAAALQSASVAFVSEPGASASALRRYVEEGGSVILSPADADNARTFGALLEELEVGRGATVVDARRDLGYETIIGEADLTHPVFAPFAGSGALLRPRFRQYVRVVPDAGTRVHARFDSGDPFLLEKLIGAGRVLAYTSSFNTAWTDLPLDEMFVPFVYRLADYGAHRDEPTLVYTVGDVVALKGRPGSTWEVRSPDDRLYRMTLDDRGSGYFRETDIPGHYRGASGADQWAFSVNVDARESADSFRDPEEAYASVAAPTIERGPGGTNPPVGSDEERRELWRWLLLLVITLFAVETWLAHRTKRSAAPVQMEMRKAA